MSHDFRMHIVSEAVGGNTPVAGLVCGVEIARIDLCRLDYHDATFKAICAQQKKPARIFGSFFADNGIDVITTDRYDCKLARIPGQFVHSLFSNEVLKGQRRVCLAAPLLDRAMDLWPAGSIYCYFFGH